MLKTYFALACRMLSKNKVSAAINVSGLAIGLAAFILIILYVKDEFTFDRFHVNHSRIFNITKTVRSPMEVFGTVNDAEIPTRAGAIFKEEIPGVTAFNRVSNSEVTVQANGKLLKTNLLNTDDNFFRFFSFRLISGNAKKVLEQPDHIVLSRATALKFFGSADATGKQVVVRWEFKNEAKTFTVSGIADDAPENSSLTYDLVSRLEERKDQPLLDDFLYGGVQTFISTDGKTPVSSITAGMNAIVHRILKAAKGEEVWGSTDVASITRYHLRNITRIHFGQEVKGAWSFYKVSDRKYSYILLSVAGMIIFLAVINFVNLSLGASLKRAKEIAIRKVNGSSRKQLMAGFLVETGVTCLAAFPLALLLVQAALPWFNQFVVKALSFKYLFDVQLLALLAGLLVLVSLMAWVYPALVLSRMQVISSLKSKLTYTGKNLFAKSLLVVQFSIAIILLISAVVYYRQFHFLTTKNLGYHDENIVVLNLPKPIRNEDKARLVKQELDQYTSVAGTSLTLGHESGSSTVYVDDRETVTQSLDIDPHYLPLIGAHFVAGTNFKANLATDSTSEVVINQAFATIAGWKDPVGKVFYHGKAHNHRYTVAGVVKDFHFSSLKEKIGPIMYSSNERSVWYGTLLIKARAGKATLLLKNLSATFKKMYPNEIMDSFWLHDSNLRQYDTEARWRTIVGMSALMTIAIACFGLFGLAGIASQQRVKEIGIRKVLGASAAAIVHLLSKDFLRLVMIAIVIASPIAWYLMNGWLQDFAYRIAISWWMFALAGALALFIALATISFQAIKAAIVNPAGSLRAD